MVITIAITFAAAAVSAVAIVATAESTSWLN
jgi:hypothetical protein